MLRVTLKGLLAHKLRFGLTTFAVVVGVAFVVGSVVLTDSVRAEFDALLEQINSDIDLTVRAEEKFDQRGFGSQASPVDASLEEPIRDIDGVAGAEGFVQGFPALAIDAEGEAVTPQGPPLGLNWIDDAVSTLILVEGHQPMADNEIAMDIGLADMGDFAVGDTVVIQTPVGNRDYDLVGTFSFGEKNALAGATLTAFTTQEAQEVFNLVDQFSEIDVGLDPDADLEAVQAEIATLLPDGVEVVDTADVVAEQQDELGALFSIFGNVLLGFAGIALFVSAFLINNTFTIVVGQRVRELALLRAVGATGRQVFVAVMGESLVVGIVAVLVGFVGGLGLALGFMWVLNQFDFGSGETNLVLNATPFIAATIIGIGVTMAAAISPAWKATTVPPVAAMREGFQLSGTSIRTRAVIGGVLVVLGAALMAFALGGQPETAVLLVSLVTGAIFVFLGVSSLSPTFAGPVARAVGAPFSRLFRMPGKLARGNAARSPRRTSSTASALMIGLALVSMALVVGESIKRSVVNTLETSITADWYIDGGFLGFTPELVAAMKELPELTSATGGRFGQIQVDGSTKQLSAVDFAVVNDLFDLDLQEGGEVGGASQGLLIHSDPANDLGVGVGDTVTVVFQTSGEVDVPILGIYQDSSVLGNWTLDLTTFEEHFTEAVDLWAAAKTAPGVAEEEARAALELAAEPYPQIEVQDRDEFAAAQEDQINGVLIVINVFLLLAVFIAFLGIMNTLALSVFERTRELGLLRAVGETRRQVWSMVTLEAVIVAVYGALLGVLIGLLFGYATASALPDDVINTIAAPWGTLVILVVVAGILGVVAALYPARRASKLNVLDAIGFE